jgi:nitrite reductase (cytochrome c-552)
VEYYFKGPEKRLTYPWTKGLKADDILSYYQESGFRDWVHAESGASVLKAQHPEFEMWNQGIHAKSGVTCVDCHMPYQRVGAMKITDHHVQSPLLNINRACQTCHHSTETEIAARVDSIQQKNHDLMQRAASALMDQLDAIVKAKGEGATPAQLATALDFQRQAQWRIDFIAAENSMGFHAPQEAARILGEAADMARQGQIAAIEWRQSGAR